MTNYLKNKFVLVVGLVAASYFAGLNKNPSFQELPARAQQAIVEQHQDAEALLTQAVSEYKRGNSKKAEELYWQFKKEAAPLKRIDPHYEELETRLFRYSAAIIDTVDIVTKHINPLYEKIMVGTPERIAEYVTASNFQGLDNHLEIIGPESGAYHRLDGDKVIQAVLLDYYADSSLRWYEAQEQMREKLKSSPNKNEQIEWAIRILDQRMEQIKKR